MATTFSRFDPEAHLTKQGWKGKGTAFKQGHATRPLPVVRKKTLTGIGKDRDESAPFWDSIFAATAASIMSSGATSAAASASTSHASSPAPDSWATLTFGAAPKPRPSVSAAARMGKEVARRGLYSKFFRGKVITPDSDDMEVVGEKKEEPQPQSRPQGDNEAGPSRTNGLATCLPDSKSSLEGGKKSSRKGKEREGETKEERRARKAEKSKRKEEKEARRAARQLVGTDAGVAVEEESAKPEDGGTKRKRRRDEEAESTIHVDTTIITPAADPKEEKKEKKKKTKKSKEVS